MKVGFRWLLALACLSVSLRQLWAGGSGLNVLIVVNQNSTNSVQLGNYYAERRQVPPQNVLRINWPGSNIEWTEADFAATLYNPLVSTLAARQLTNQIDYVVLSMDIPYRVNSSPSKPNSTTSALFYGFKSDTDLNTCSLPPSSTNLYAGTEGIFRSTPPVNANSSAWLVTMITHSNLALAKQIVDSGTMADATFPTQTVYLAKSTDTARNVRYWTFDNAQFNTRLRSNFFMQRTNSDFNWIFGTALGLQQGVYYSTVAGTTFVPGAMADNLTSYGGQLFEPASSQLKLFQFLTAGAAGSYGTVTEPCNYLEKFPSPQNYFYQARGFSLAECYYLSLTNPYMGVLVGEPLAAPFALAPDGSWVNLPLNAVLSGTTNLSLQGGGDAARPIQQVDLFLDGLWLQTLTNLPPARSNLLNVTLNGQAVNYLVPLNATVQSVAAGLTSALNASAISNVTKVAAFAHGDRIELQSLDRSKKGPQVPLTVSNSIGAGTSATTRMASSGTNFLDTIATGIRNFQMTGTPILGSFLFATITKTNGGQFTFAVTNTSGSMTLTEMAQQLISQINASPDMAAADGLRGQDLVTDALNPVQITEFNLAANSSGWDAAQIHASLIGSFTITPLSTVTLEDNLADLRPRTHLYVTSGLTNLALNVPWNTTALPNGWHELAAVFYEGSHVRTQKKITQTIQIQNGGLSANFVSLVGATNAALEGTLKFSVIANTNAIAKIELFSTGGSVGIVNGQASATFSVPGISLGVGLHPFYAVVTANSGKQYKTETLWLRLTAEEPAFTVSITAPPPSLNWPATPGRSYQVLAAPSPGGSFQTQATVLATNSLAQWSDTNSPPTERFYRVRTAN